MILDSHLHIWDPGRAEYAWLGPEIAAVNRSIGFPEIAPTLAELGVDGVVLVQAADNAEDTALMLEAAEAHDEIVGVVAWAPLDDPRALEGRLEELTAMPVVRGVRNLFHARPREWAVSPAVDQGLALLEAADLPVDFVTSSPDALAELPEIGRRHPGLRIVIDHLGKPPIGGGADERSTWRELLAAAAANPLTHAKVSGLYAAVGELDSWTEDAIRPFVRDALELFGAERLMYGGDWPISLLAGGYRRSWDAISSIADTLTPSERAALLGGTAERFYRLPGRGAS
jgi:L-fuconolactonase